MSNSNIYNAIKDEIFIEDTSIHKYPYLWVGKFHQKLNHILRNNNLEKILKKFTATVFYIQQVIRYFVKHGVTKEQLKQQGIHKLYRGIQKKFVWSGKEFFESSFLATSSNILVSEDFAESEGTLLIFNVDELPDKIPFIILDDKIHPMLKEKEVLCLLGSTITTELITDSEELNNITKTLKHNNLKHIYKCKYTLKSEYITKIMNINKGGSLREENKINTSLKPPIYNSVASGKIVTKQEKPIKHYLLPNKEMAGKYVVFYRAILDRPVEVFSNSKLPSDEDELYRFLGVDIKVKDVSYNEINKYIPQLQDLRELQSNKNSAKLTKLINSYDFHMAIYDPVDKIVIDTHYSEPYFIGNEFEVDTSRNKEVINAIVERMDGYN